MNYDDIRREQKGTANLTDTQREPCYFLHVMEGRRDGAHKAQS